MIHRFVSAWAAAAAVLLAAASPSIAAKRSLTLDDLYAKPPITGTLIQQWTWIPGRTKAAFSYLAKGGTTYASETDLWIEDARSGHKELALRDRSLLFPDSNNTSPSDADARTHTRHLSLSGYQWTPDGQALLLSGDHDLWLVPLATKIPQRLTHDTADESHPTFSPNGRRIAYVKKSNLYVFDLLTRKEIQLTHDGTAHVFNGRLDWVYTEEISNRSGKAFDWSPDSKKIAYLRLDENRVPVYPLVHYLSIPHARLHEQRYPNPGDPNSIPSVHAVAMDGRQLADIHFPQNDLYVVPEFDWRPDSSAFVMETLNRNQTRLIAKWVVLGKGTGRTLFQEHDRFWINLPDRINRGSGGGNVRFLPGKRFLWISERSGFRHIYCGRFGKGSTARPSKPLTHGRWMVDGIIGLDQTNRWIYFTSTRRDPRQRQIDRVHFDGTGLASVTHAAGVHSGELSPHGRYLIETESTLTQLPQVRLLDDHGHLLRVVDSRPNRLKGFLLPSRKLVTLKAGDGTPLYALLTRPPHFDPAKKYPVLVYVYGGPHVQLVRESYRGPSLWDVLADKGYLVWSLDNRGSWGRGHAFETPIFERMGTVELRDQLRGVRYLKSLPYVDPTRMGITGWSYGGYMTLYALTHAPKVWKCGAAGAPVTDWRLYDTIYTERYMRTPKVNPKGYKSSSPLAVASALKAKLLIIHGSADDNVHLYNSLNFVNRLIQAGIPYDLEVVPGQRHGFSGIAARKRRDRLLLHFFENNL